MLTCFLVNPRPIEHLYILYTLYSPTFPCRYSICTVFTTFTNAWKQTVTYCNDLALSIMLFFKCSKFLHGIPNTRSMLEYSHLDARYTSAKPLQIWEKTSRILPTLLGDTRPTKNWYDKDQELSHRYKQTITHAVNTGSWFLTRKPTLILDSKGRKRGKVWSWIQTCSLPVRRSSPIFLLRNCRFCWIRSLMAQDV